jgi:hypothetical protein
MAKDDYIAEKERAFSKREDVEFEDKFRARDGFYIN